MADPFVGEVRCVGFNFSPVGWAACNGQLLPISQNTALFSLLGTYYGGDGRSTFGLPNLQGNVAIAQGQGAGLSDRAIGETGGAAAVTLLNSEMPSHNHNYMIDELGPAANSGHPGSNTCVAHGTLAFTNAAFPMVQMAPNSLGVTGSSQPHNNMMPYLVLNFIIAMQGIFPPKG